MKSAIWGHQTSVLIYLESIRIATFIYLYCTNGAGNETQYQYNINMISHQLVLPRHKVVGINMDFINHFEFITSITNTRKQQK